MVASKLLLAIATIGLALPVEAAPAPIVFDFEDGLQGWELSGSAQRVQTQVLGGEWAIFGDGLGEGRAFLSTERDLTNVAFISVEQFFVDGSEDGLLLATTVRFGVDVDITTLDRLDVVPLGNPSLRGVDVSSITGVKIIHFAWDLLGPPPPLVAFIDNITFHPVPEPSSLALLAFGLAALVIARRRIV